MFPSSSQQPHSRPNRSSSTSRSRSRSRSKASDFALPHTSVVGHSGSSDAPSPVFGAYSVPTSPSRIPSLRLDESDRKPTSTSPSTSTSTSTSSKYDSIKLRTKRSYPNLSSKKPEPSTRSSTESSHSSISSPFHRTLETEVAPSPSTTSNFPHDQIVVKARKQVGIGNARQNQRREIWDLEQPSTSRYVQQNQNHPTHPGLREVNRQLQSVGIDSDDEVGDGRAVRHDSKAAEESFAKAASSSNLSLSSTSSAPALSSHSTVTSRLRPTSSSREKKQSQANHQRSMTQLVDLKMANSSSSSLPIPKTSPTHLSHSSERFQKIRNSGKRDVPLDIRIDSSSTAGGERPSSSLSTNSSFSNLSSSNDSSLSYSSSPNSASQESRLLKTFSHPKRKGRGRIGEECQTPTQNSWSKDNNSSSTTLDSNFSSSGSNVNHGKYLSVSSSFNQPSTIRYNIVPNSSRSPSRSPGNERSNPLDKCDSDGFLKASGRGREKGNEASSHLVLSLEGDVMFASKLKKGFFKSLSGKIGEIELRKGGIDGPIVMQANPNSSKSFSKLNNPSFNMTRYPSPAIIGEYRGLMMNPKFRSSSQILKSSRLDLVGDFGTPDSPESPLGFGNHKLDMSGWSGNLRQVDVWGQRWDFSLPRYDSVPLAKALLEKEDEKKTLFSSSSSTRSSSPANRSHSPSNPSSKFSLKNSNTFQASNSMPNLTSSSAMNQQNSSKSIIPSPSTKRKISPVETHLTSFALGQKDGDRLYEWIGAGSSKWELIERDVSKTKGRQKVCATFLRQVTVKEGAGSLTFDQDFPDEEVLILSLISLLDWHMRSQVY